MVVSHPIHCVLWYLRLFYFYCPVPFCSSCYTHSTACIITCLGAIQLGSKTAFTDLVGAFILLTTVSYGKLIPVSVCKARRSALSLFRGPRHSAIPTLAHVITRRKTTPIGPFWMGKYGWAVNISSVVLTAFFFVMYVPTWPFPRAFGHSRSPARPDQRRRCIFTGFASPTPSLFLTPL